jgi:hypothetical protein
LLLLETFEFGLSGPPKDLKEEIIEEILIKDSELIENNIEEAAMIAEGMVYTAEAIFGMFGEMDTTIFENVKEMIEEVKETEENYLSEIRKREEMN